MKIILRADVENLGHLGDVVSVKPGYGRNYLVPQGKATAATEANIAEFEKRRAEYEAKASQQLAGAEARQDLRKVYEAAFAKLQPKYGHWVIFNHCMPFDVTRAYDEASGHADPRIWTAERDREMWLALEG